MHLEISLNKNQIMWFLPNGKCHLTLENPGPVEVDFESLDKESQKLIIIAGRNKVITLSKEDSALVEIFNGNIIPEFVKPVPQVTKTIIEAIVEKRSEEEIKLRAILNKSTHTIKKEVCLLEDPRLLQSLLDLEKSNLNRKKVLEIIIECQESFHTNVVSSIKEEADPDAKIVVDPITDNLKVVDSEVEERKIPLESDV